VRQPRQLVGRGADDGLEVARAADRLRQVVDQRQLAVPLEGLVGERPLVPLARGRVREHRRDPAGGPTALDRAQHLAVDGDLVAGLARPGAIALEDDLAVRVADRDRGVGAGQQRRDHRRDMAVADDEAPQLAHSEPRTSCAIASSSSGSNGFVR
jgi:hypothetical protein